MLTDVMQDVRFALRTLWRNRLFALSVVMILAIGIAASTGLFAIIDAVVLHPLPFTDADRLARIQILEPSRRPRPATVTADEFLVLRRASTLDDAYIRELWTKTLSGTPFPESVSTENYTGNALLLLGVSPLIGRVFTEAEAPVGPPPPHVAILTHRFWQRRFAGQPNAVGQVLTLDGEPFTVIGVMPSDYSLDGTDVVVPLPTPFDARAAWPVTVRIKAGVSATAVEADLQQVFQRFAESRPDAFAHDAEVRIRRVVDEERSATYVPILTLLFAAAALLLLIGCVNVTILHLARGRRRVQEMAVRHALGAARLRLVRLLLCETLIVTALAAAVAVIAVHQLLPLLLASVPGTIAGRAGRIVVGPAALLFASAVTMIATVVAGVWPAVTVSRLGSDAMRSATATRTGSATRQLGSSGLIAAQVTIAVVLLAGTGAAVRALVELYRAPVGYDPVRITVAMIYLPTERFTTWAERVSLYERIRREVAGVASVESSTISLIPTGPPPRTGMGTRVDVEGGGGSSHEVLAHSVASDYFSTLKMPLIRGHGWSEADDARAGAVAVINETMARQWWPNENPIGRLVRDMSFAARRPQWLLNAPGRDGWFEIIGVMRDAPNQGLHEPIAPAIYYPYTAALSDMVVLLVRTKGNPGAAESALRAAVARAYSNLPIIRFGGPEVFFGWQQAQFVSAVLMGFAGVALLLASFGLFSASSYLVASRTREFGIRLALGATAGGVRWLALKSTVIAVGAGLGAGLTLTVALDPVLGRWSIRDVDDPTVLLGVAIILSMATLGATFIPARRATTIEPATALRSE